MQDVSKICTIKARLPDGTCRYLEAPAGWRLMEVLRDYGVPLRLNAAVPTPAQLVTSTSSRKDRRRRGRLMMKCCVLTSCSMPMKARACPAKS